MIHVISTCKKLRLDGWLPVKYFIKAPRNGNLRSTELFVNLVQRWLRNGQRLLGFKVGQLVSDAFAQQPYCSLQATKINYSTCDVEDLEFDRDVSMPSWALPAFLISQKKTC